MSPRRVRMRAFTAPVLASLALHAAALGAIAARGREGPAPSPPIYAVALVSPPPARMGPPNPGAGTPDAPIEATAVSSVASADAAATNPPPAPARKTPTPRRTPSSPPAEALSSKSAASREGTRAQAQSSVNGREVDGARALRSPTPGESWRAATGPNPDSASAGGEDLRVASGGLRCPDEGYCANIVRQIHRFFRRPAEAHDDQGEICFRIERDGSATDLRVERLRGSPAFRVALLEAAEQAGRRRAFGPLPPTFDREWLPVCVLLRPLRP